jgi:hypothetical protein
MSIAFESDEVQLVKLRERLRQMSDEELIKFGKMVRGQSAPRAYTGPRDLALSPLPACLKGGGFL